VYNGVQARLQLKLVYNISILYSNVSNDNPIQEPCGPNLALKLRTTE
jgi:hypothetical protein